MECPTPGRDAEAQEAGAAQETSVPSQPTPSTSKPSHICAPATTTGGRGDPAAAPTFVHLSLHRTTWHLATGTLNSCLLEMTNVTRTGMTRQEHDTCSFQP